MQNQHNTVQDDKGGKQHDSTNNQSAPDKPQINVHVEIEVYDISDENIPVQFTQEDQSNYQIIDICNSYRPINTKFSTILQEFQNQLEKAQAFNDYQFTTIQVRNTQIAIQFNEINEMNIEQFFQDQNIVHDSQHLREILITANVS